MADADLATTPRPTNTPTTANTNTHTSSSAAAADLPQLKAPKDKNCPFCGQAFTSSSLGRHLDLYIRPKNPKAPDGIHIVDDIRRLRGAITRRQAKGSVSRRADSSASTPHHQKHSVGSDGSTPAQDPSPPADHHDDLPDDDHLHPDTAPQHAFRDVSWGGAARRAPDVRRDAARVHRKAGLDARRRRSSDDVASTGAAAEMALRELLHSVREASTRAAANGLFDVDPCTLNFPSLCLHMLPAPATLFSPTPFATSDSWSVSPPGQKQLDALNRHVRERLLAHQRQRHINNAYPLSTSTTAANPLPTPPLFDPDPQKLFCHIADAYQHWSLQSEATRQEHWHMEVLRCYARANEARRDAETQLQRARREIEYLKANRNSTGFSDFSPVNITLGTDTAKELAKQGMDFRNWDFDRLIDKWKTHLRENAATAPGMAAQKQLPGAHDSTRSASMASLPPNQPTMGNIRPSHGSPIKMETAMPFSAPSTVAGGSVSDHVDAEGDDDNDDDGSGHDMHQDSHVSDTDAMNQHHQSHHQHQQQQQQQQQQQHQQHQHQHQHQQQHQQHGMPLQPTPMHHPQQLQSHMQSQIHVSQAQAQAHVQAHAHAQAQAQAHAQAQAQAWAAARQHMNQSRNQDFRPHQHQQLSPHLQHMASATNSRRPSVVMMDPHAMSLGLPTGMEGMDDHQDQFLRMDMGLPTGFGPDGRVTMGT